MSCARHAVAVLAGFVLAAGWSSWSSASPASHPAHSRIAIDSTNYQSTQQLLANTQVMVVARVESVGIDRSAPASEPASLATVRTSDVVRGHVGKRLVVEQPRGRPSQVGQVMQAPLRKDRTYLLLLARDPGTGFYFLVGGSTGEFSYNSKTKRFTRVDASALWEESDFSLSLAKIGANVMPEPTQPSWLTSPSGSHGSEALSWSSMANDLGLSATDVTCPSETLCLFAGTVSPASPGEEVPAVAVSAGPFTAQASVVGTTTTFPPSSDAGPSYVACAGPALCVVSSVDGVYLTTDPTAAHWTREVAPSTDYGFGQISCPTASFCAVAAGSGVLVSGSPSSGPTAWNYIRTGNLGQAISCPSAELCVAGGFGDTTVGGWIETSGHPLVPASWHGGPTPHPQFAQHSGQYGVTGISCPTAAFCVAAVEAGAPLVSTDPAGGVATWSVVANGSKDLGIDNPGIAACTAAGQCSVSGVGTFGVRGGASVPGIIGYPLPGVSCVSTSFCVTVTDDVLAVGQVTG